MEFHFHQTFLFISFFSLIFLHSARAICVPRNITAPSPSPSAPPIIRPVSSPKAPSPSSAPATTTSPSSGSSSASSSASSTASSPASNSASTPTSNSASTPTSTSASTPASTSSSTPASTSASTSTSTPASNLGSTPASTSTSTPASTSGSTPTSTSGSTPTSTPSSSPPSESTSTSALNPKNIFPSNPNQPRLPFLRHPVHGVLSAVAAGALGGGAGPGPANPELKKVCDSTDYPDICLSTLSPLTKIPGDIRSVVNTAIKAGLDFSKVALSAAEKMASQPGAPPDEAPLIKDCKDSFDDASYNFERAMEAFPANDVGTMNTMLSAAITDIGDCEDAFKGKICPLTTYCEKLTKMASNCLAIISTMH